MGDGVRVNPLAAALVAASLMVASCASEGPPRGSVMIVVDTNVTPGRDFDTLRVRVQDDPSTEVAYHYAWDDAAQRASVLDDGYLPFTVNVQNARDGLAERQVSVTAWKDGAPVFAREARLVLPVSGTKLLRMPVEALCFPQLAAEGARPVAQPERGWAVSCAQGQTCFGGSCASAHVDATKLEDHAPEAVFGRAKEPGQGGACVDALACFTRRAKADGSLDEARLAQVVEPTLEGSACTLNVELLRGRENLIVGVEVPDAFGTCGATGCVALLDRVADATEEIGWQALGGRVLLPSAVCAKGLRLFVRVSPDSACPLKQPSISACGEARSVGGVLAASAPSSSNRAAEAFVLDGGGQGSVVCAERTASGELCAAANTACGELLWRDPRCAVPYYPSRRVVRCRANGETTACASADVTGMRRIPGGRFSMGSTQEEVDTRSAFENELPQHLVDVRDFWLDTTEVTAGAFEDWCAGTGKDTATCKGSDGEGFAPGGACTYGTGRRYHPMNCVTWFEASAYCAAQGKRLPTEEEWEYAARSGSRQFAYPWGNDAPAELSLSGVAVCDEPTCAVGSFSPAADSANGVKDLAGNVEEWTSSVYNAPYGSYATRNDRVIRGGSSGLYADKSFVLRAAFREGWHPEFRWRSVGFRCAR